MLIWFYLLLLFGMGLQEITISETVQNEERIQTRKEGEVRHDSGKIVVSSVGGRKLPFHTKTTHTHTTQGKLIYLHGYLQRKIQFDCSVYHNGSRMVSFQRTAVIIRCLLAQNNRPLVVVVRKPKLCDCIHLLPKWVDSTSDGIYKTRASLQTWLEAHLEANSRFDFSNTPRAAVPILATDCRAIL